MRPLMFLCYVPENIINNIVESTNKASHINKGRSNQANDCLPKYVWDEHTWDNVSIILDNNVYILIWRKWKV